MSAKMIGMICWCGKHYSAREADINRGWGLSCSKSHAAIRRDYGKPKATREDGVKVRRVKKKDRGANRTAPDTRHYVRLDGRLVDTRKVHRSVLEDIQHERDMEGTEVGWDAHKEVF